ncbi:hypothetical protein [Dysgonomonas sp. 37-18]|uniref:hypothetical protein n=1 Tax=Dysgonomonas sp. 37-18 TaxID=1895907 RepID=UPI00092A8517|nr:hypothetical protein [Dysgonomonas sp. 37-18]OJX63091.1 MAG: hypothetical protein BGO84_14400 [Dysgonomonas sp. 37-18]
MRKFNLFDKVLFTPENSTEKVLACIVGFTTDEEDGCIIDRESGGVIEPDEHAYVLIQEVEGFDVSLTECQESEIEAVLSLKA